MQWQTKAYADGTHPSEGAAGRGRPANTECELCQILTAS